MNGNFSIKKKTRWAKNSPMKRNDGLQSASANITLGLLPPSSSVVLFIFDAPAACIISDQPV